MASLDVATSLRNIKTAWSNLTTWQSLCGVASAALAAERIFIGGTEENEETIVPVTIIMVESLPLRVDAFKLRGSLTTKICCELAVPSNNSLSYQDEYLWVWGQWALIMAGLEANSNQTGGLMLDHITTDQLPGQKDSTINKGRQEWGFSFNYTSYLV
ncbi:MAG TPA: hypothetical protein PLR25_23375 [Planctomycetaceae bacterium]|nr:hypothetical protein [Planctomycetaceae bacterium]